MKLKVKYISLFLSLTGITVSCNAQNNTSALIQNAKPFYPLLRFDPATDSIKEVNHFKGVASFSRNKTEDVFSVADAEVMFIQEYDTGAYGITLKSGDYFISYFGLTLPLVKKGDHVHIGQKISTIVKLFEGGYELLVYALYKFEQDAALPVNDWVEFQKPFQKNRGFIFDSGYAAKLLKPCSRAVPDNINSYWRAEQNDIDKLENNIEKIYLLRSAVCCNKGKALTTLSGYCFQYAGITINGEKYIYINAFPEYRKSNLEKAGVDLHKVPVGECDNGPSYWGAVYSPKQEHFIFIAFDGNL